MNGASFSEKYMYRIDTEWTYLYYIDTSTRRPSDLDHVNKCKEVWVLVSNWFTTYILTILKKVLVLHEL